MSNSTDWDFNNNHVQNDIKPGKFINGKSTLLAFGPPRFSDTKANGLDDAVTFDSEGFSGSIIPVGLVQNMTLSQQQQVDKIFEIGSARVYHVVGRTIPNFGFTKVLYDGPSLMKFAYSYYLKKEQGKITSEVDMAKIQALFGTATNVDVKTNEPGQSDLFLNLASNLFKLPIGVLLWFKNNLNGNYGAVYLEDCYISSNSLGMDVGGSIVAEQCSIELDRIVPVSVK